MVDQDTIDKVNVAASAFALGISLLVLLVGVVLIAVKRRKVNEVEAFLKAVGRHPKSMSVSEMMNHVFDETSKDPLAEFEEAASTNEHGYGDKTKGLTVELPETVYAQLKSVFTALFHVTPYTIESPTWSTYGSDATINSIVSLTSSGLWSSLSEAERYALVATMTEWLKNYKGKKDAGVFHIEDVFNDHLAEYDDQRKMVSTALETQRSSEEARQREIMKAKFLTSTGAAKAGGGRAGEETKSKKRSGSRSRKRKSVPQIETEEGSAYVLLGEESS